MSELDLLIVGGGPAGMSAALEAAQHGVRSCLVDEGATLGGQIHRAPLSAAARSRQKADDPGAVLRNRIASQRDLIEVRSNSVVWGISEGKKVGVVSDDEKSEILRPRMLVLATGAYEYVPPFSGWTLPGVMTPGAAQILAKTMDILPGQRILLAGTGPFLLVVACALLERGAQIVSVLEASPMHAWLALPFRSFRAWDHLFEGLGYLRTLRRAGVSIRYGRIVTSAGGSAELASVTHAAVDVDWNPDYGREETEVVDTLGIGYGFVSRAYLAQLAGCSVSYRPERGGWIPVRDRDLCTDVEDVFSVGDCSGVAGALPAALEGRLVGLIAASRLGAIDDSEVARRRRPIERELSRIQSLRSRLDKISAIRPGLSNLVTDETLVCRCEEVTWKEARESIYHGGRDFATLKIMSRIGMGLCQGRFCWPALSRKVAEECGTSTEQVGPASPRPPIRPVSLGALAAIESFDGGDVR